MSDHISVLMNEVIEGLDISPNDIIVDATVNGGGHASEITKRLSSKGIFIGLDLDSKALKVSEERLQEVECKVSLVNQSFADLDIVLKDLKLDGFDKILFDLGWSSNQFEDPSRGFSFNHEGPLHMSLRDDLSKVAFTAHDIVNTWEKSSLIDILQGYGEERYAWKISEAIAAHREEKIIETTTELAEIISQAVPKKYRNGKIHPATKSFQALRIAVNNEMEVLKEGLEKAFNHLHQNGKMLVISFHSTEDRIVKHYFRKLKDEGRAQLFNKKPLTATEEELSENRRSRSAKLRIITKI